MTGGDPDGGNFTIFDPSYLENFLIFVQGLIFL
jgi:hypothetical protein